jgi:hypothetical protein
VRVGGESNVTTDKMELKFGPFFVFLGDLNFCCCLGDETKLRCFNLQSGWSFVNHG